MSPIALAAIIALVSFLFLSKFLKKVHGSKNLPKRSLGFPLIGETISFFRVHKKEQGAEWVNKRLAIFKTSVMGTPSVIIVGVAGNKFVLGSGDDVFATNRPKRTSALQGKYNIFELSGSR